MFHQKLIMLHRQNGFSSWQRHDNIRRSLSAVHLICRSCCDEFRTRPVTELGLEGTVYDRVSKVHIIIVRLGQQSSRIVDFDCRPEGHSKASGP